MIKVLDEKTIDKIAAGEVIERPASIVKELLENAVDAGATSISVDIKNGGIDQIRVTDNGSGIDRNEVRTAFLPHATSKLTKIEDLYSITSLGFRGEALPSIASVSKVEVLTKPVHDEIGVRYVIEGGTEVSFDDAGLPDGTTFIVRDLFYNTPARRKFLKSANTEAGQITALIEEIAMAYPHISFKYSVNGNTRLLTSGKGDLKDVIYRIYGKDISDSLLHVNSEHDGLKIQGYISKPLIARNSRSMENYFVNTRYIKDDIIRKAIEDGYAGFLMQHRFPFTSLYISMPVEDTDINVHPRKMEIKFSDPSKVYEFIREAVRDTLSEREFINKVSFGKEERPAPAPVITGKAGESFTFEKKPEVNGPSFETPGIKYEEIAAAAENEFFKEDLVYSASVAAPVKDNDNSIEDMKNETVPDTVPAPAADFTDSVKGEQLDLFEEKILDKDKFSDYRIVGQIFDTYWIIQYKDEMLLMDQHAAHEKVNYERFMEEFKKREITSQNLNPPILITLDGAHREVLERFLPRFNEMGFEIEPFGGNDFSIRTVPYNLLGLNEEEVLVALLDELSSSYKDEEISVIHEKIASMSCKAAIKGNTAISYEEAEALIRQLLTLKDPYNCPHGRPTIIRMSKNEVEKKFKRVL